MVASLFRTGMVFTLLLSILVPAQADELAELTKRVEALEGSVKSLETVVKDNASQIGKLAGNIGELTELLKLSNADLTDRLTNQAAEQQKLLDQIMSSDENGEVYLTLNSIMNKSGVAREEVRKAVEQSIRTQGTLTIVNEMSTAQDIVVNNVQQRVQPGATLNLTVPVGTATTQLPGQDIVNWTIGVPNYRQSVTIKPRYTAARPTTPSSNSVGHSVYYGAPAYETTVYRAPVYQTPLYYDSYYGGNYYSNYWLGSYFIY